MTHEKSQISSERCWQFKGLEIVSRGGPFKDSTPDLFIRGKEMYQVNLNPESPTGTIASIESVLRSFDRRAEDEKLHIEQQEKTFSDYKTQLNKPFEHEARLKDLLVEQARLNALLDLDKHESQVVAEDKDCLQSLAALAQKDVRRSDVAR